jgi:hypothetical protein
MSRYGDRVIVANDSTGGTTGQSAFTVSVELSMVLTAQGPHGERALNLLRDAAAVLSDPARWNAPYEVAQSCCRGAIDINLALKDIEGIEEARKAVTDAAKAAIEAWRTDDQLIEGLLDALAAAVDALQAEEDNPGGRRGRQIGHLVQELTRQEMGWRRPRPCATPGPGSTGTPLASCTGRAPRPSSPGSRAWWWPLGSCSWGFRNVPNGCCIWR